MRVTKIVVLKKAAARNGGDRYEDPTDGFNIYIPQSVSRGTDPTGGPYLKIKVTLDNMVGETIKGTLGEGDPA